MNITLLDGSGPDVDPFLVHEALDRTHVAICMVDDHILTHPFVAQRPEIRDLIEQALGSLATAYQKIGAYSE